MSGKLEVAQFFELVGSFLSLFLNSFLLYLIHRFSRPEYGSYRILMMVMTSLYIVYSAIEMIVLPSYFVVDYNYLLFTTNFINHRQLSQHLISTFCAIFGVMQMVLAFQFIFRYLCVVSSSQLRERFFKGKRHISWIFFTLLFFLNWYLVATFVFANNGCYQKELEVAVSERFERNMSQMAYVLVSYANLNTNGNGIEVYWLNIAMILYILVCASIPMIISLYCGIKTWLEIHMTVNMMNKSYRVQRQERQLFFALLIQFTVPFFGNTVPMIILFLCPALYISPEPYTNYICMLIPFYPIFDAVATIYVIKDYYRAVFKLFGLSRCVQYNSSVNTGNAPPNTLFSTPNSGQVNFLETEC